MKAAVLHEVKKPLVIEDVSIDKPRSREVLIRTVAAGVCHSDLHFIDGLFPFPLPTVPGHEFAGVVEAVGSEVRMVKIGDHVITCLNAFCGHCEHCVTGHMARCVNPEVRRDPTDTPRLSRKAGVLNQFANLSSFAERMLVHEHACVSVRKDMPLDRAALIGCAVVTGFGAVNHTAERAVRRDGRGDRLRRGRAFDHQLRGDRRRRAHHRHRPGRLEAQSGEAFRRHRRHRRRARAIRSSR